MTSLIKPYNSRGDIRSEMKAPYAIPEREDDLSGQIAWLPAKMTENERVEVPVVIEDNLNKKSKGGLRRYKEQVFQAIILFLKFRWEPSVCQPREWLLTT